MLQLGGVRVRILTCSCLDETLHFSFSKLTNSFKSEQPAHSGSVEESSDSVGIVRASASLDFIATCILLILPLAYPTLSRSLTVFNRVPPIADILSLSSATLQDSGWYSSPEALALSSSSTLALCWHALHNFCPGLICSFSASVASAILRDFVTCF